MAGYLCELGESMWPSEQIGLISSVPSLFARCYWLMSSAEMLFDAACLFDSTCTNMGGLLSGRLHSFFAGSKPRMKLLVGFPLMSHDGHF